MAKWALKLAKHTAVGGAAGFVAGRIVSSANDSPAGGRAGGIAGAITGAATGLPFGKLALGLKGVSATYARGLKATPGSKVGGALRATEHGISKGKMAFRRVRGRIIPIRVK